HQLAHLDFRRRNGHAVLLIAVVLHPTLHIQPVTLADVVFRDLRQLVPERETVPLRTLLDRPVLARNPAAGRQREVRDADTAGRRLHVRIPTNVSDQDDLVDGSTHECLRWCEFAPERCMSVRGRPMALRAILQSKITCTRTSCRPRPSLLRVARPAGMRWSSPA